MGHKVGVVVGSCDSLKVITTGLLIKVSLFCILKCVVVDSVLHLASLNMQPFKILRPL